jgi:cell wall-associated NlpC family hydrolase
VTLNKASNSIFLVLLVCVLSSFARAQETGADAAKMSADTLAAVQKDTFPQIRNSKQVDELIGFAKTFLGTPYHYAGSTPSGFDCSGFINYVFGNFGIELTRSSYGIAELGETVKLSDIRPGDLMFFKGSNVHSTKVGHVAMVIEVSPDVIKFIHSSTSRGVVIDNFKTSKYYIPRFIKAKRLDYGTSGQSAPPPLNPGLLPTGN